MAQPHVQLTPALPECRATHVLNPGHLCRLSLSGLMTAFAFSLFISALAFAQSATGRPEKPRTPVKPPVKRLPTTTPNKTTTQNPEDKTVQQPMEVKPNTQEVKQPVQTVEPNPKINEPKLSVPQNLLKQVLNCVGLIMVRNKSDEAAVPRGSGVIISKDGIIATNYHVVREDNQDRLFDEIFFSLPEVGMPATSASARRFTVQVVQKSKDNDLALLRIMSELGGKSPDKNFDFQAVELGDSSKVELMDNLVIVGFPATGGLTVTTNGGVVQGKDVIENWIKTDARLLHGNSGGAAIDDQGKLIGIPTKVEVDRHLVKQYSQNSQNQISKDAEQVYAIGYLRPSNLVAKMVETLRYLEAKPLGLKSGGGANTANEAPRDIIVKGVLKFSDGNLIAGATVGIVSADGNLISWGKTTADGMFTLNNPVAPGTYQFRVRPTGFALMSKEIEISPKQEPIVIEFKKTP
jgi:S1-C subfamily serine protease